MNDIKHIATALLHTKGRPDGSVEHCDLSKEYKEHVLKFLEDDHRPIKMVVDASNGMAGKMVPIIFNEVKGRGTDRVEP